jgi:hypothetical protein
MENMLKKIKTLAVLAMTLAAAGCATPPQPISGEQSSQIKRVAVISMVGDVFTRQYVGLTVFGNEREEKDITNWGLDQQYEAQIGAEVAKGRSLLVVKAPYPASDFAHVNDLNGPWSAPAFWGPNWTTIEAATRTYCSANSLDALFVLAKGKTGDFLSGTNQVFGSAGIYVRGTPFGNGASVLYLISHLALLDCKTGKTLAVRQVAQNQTDAPGAIVRSSPLMSIPTEISRTPIPQWSEQMQEKVRADLVNLPLQTWTPTINSMLAPGK